MDSLNIIRNANETGRKKIDLSNLKFEKIPDELLKIEFLEELYLRNNNIERIPKEICKLKNLKYLDCSNNNIEEIPKELFSLGKLREIRLRNNKIKFIPDLKYSLSSIVYFDISDNRLDKIAKNFFMLDTLAVVDFRDNRIKTLPKEISRLKNLKKIKLSNNKLTSLPDELYELINLEEFHIRSNSLEYISEYIGNLKNLVYLGVSNNKLESIPETIIKLDKLNILNLNDNIIQNLPDALYKLKNLTELNLSNNNIKVISDKIIELKNLNILNIRDNNLKEIPEVLADIKSLEDLDIRNNMVKDIPIKLKNCKRIFLRTDDFFKDNIQNKLTVVKELSDISYSFKIFNNKIIVELPYIGLNEFPKDIFDLKDQVVEINLKNNRIKNIPKEIFQLKKLKKLNLSGNLIEDLPNELFELSNLKELHLSENNISFLSENIRNLSEIEYLYLNKNKIKRLPKTFKYLKKLKCINFENNPLMCPPLEIAKKGIDYISSYFEQIDSDVVNIYDLKLIFIGKNGFGEERFISEIGKIKNALNEDFKINTLFFSDKEFFKYANIDFLGEKTGFLIFNNEDIIDKVSYCINMILTTNLKNYIFILNKSKKGFVNKSELKYHFDYENSQIITFENSINIKRIICNIKYYVKDLENYKKLIPRRWIEIKNIIENMNEIYINLDVFYKICDNKNLRNKKYKLMVLEYLHDVSSVIYFKNDKVLKNFIFIKPQKVIDYIGDILNSNYVKRIEEPLSIEKDLLDYLNIKKDLFIKILYIMTRFKLCYRLYNSDFFVIPQMLNENRPKYLWDDKAELILRIKYEFLPRTVINRLIVDFNKFIYDNVVWKRGFVISLDNSFAEIIECFNKSEIRVRVCGKNKNKLMSILIYEIKKMNCDLGDFKYQLLIPCNCKVCLKSSRKYYHDYLNLKRALNLRKDKIQCMNGFNMVDIKILIENYEYFDKYDNNIASLKRNLP